MKIMLLILTLVITATLANENKNDQNKSTILHRERRIDFDFISGEYLIYDCRKKHFVCVSEISFNKCKLLESIEKNIFACIQFKKFDSNQFCIEKQIELINQNGSKSFCNKKIK